jgi:hypothetical protein
MTKERLLQADPPSGWIRLQLPAIGTYSALSADSATLNLRLTQRQHDIHNHQTFRSIAHAGEYSPLLRVAVFPVGAQVHRQCYRQEQVPHEGPHGAVLHWQFADLVRAPETPPESEQTAPSWSRGTSIHGYYHNHQDETHCQFAVVLQSHQSPCWQVRSVVHISVSCRLVVIYVGYKFRFCILFAYWRV